MVPEMDVKPRKKSFLDGHRGGPLEISAVKAQNKKNILSRPELKLYPQANDLIILGPTSKIFNVTHQQFIHFYLNVQM